MTVLPTMPPSSGGCSTFSRYRFHIVGQHWGEQTIRSFDIALYFKYIGTKLFKRALKESKSLHVYVYVWILHAYTINYSIYVAIQCKKNAIKLQAVAMLQTIEI